MKGTFTKVILLALACTLVGYAQTRYNFQFVKAFPDTSFKGSLGGHGVAVDPAGKVWIQKYSPSDSILNGQGTYSQIRVVYCFNPNGTAAAFSPIKTVTVSAVTDTLFNSSRGMRADHSGNIVFASFDVLYRLNYTTGAGMAKVKPQPNNTAVAPGFDDLNEMFEGNVIDGAGPIKIYDASFNFLGNVVDTSRGFSRSIEVSADGNDVFFAGFTNSSVYKYHSANGSLGPYSQVDTVMKGLVVQCITRHNKTGYYWVGTGDPTSGSNDLTKYTNFSFYAFAPPNFTTPVDSFKWNGPTVNEPRPRGIAFSPSGDTVYVVQFNDASSPICQMFKRTITGVEELPTSQLPANYKLEQNFPNPFNPSTEIRFTVAKAGKTNLRIYDMLGREVETLVDQDLVPGSYKATFNAGRLSSGTYIYILTSGDQRISKKMLLLK